MTRSGAEQVASGDGLGPDVARLLPRGVISGRVGGADVTSTGASISVRNPADGSELASIGAADGTVVGNAVTSATEAFEGAAWGGLPPSERGRLLAAVSAKIRASAAQLAELETLDTGKPLSQARNDVTAAARYFEFYAGIADKLNGETIPLAGDDFAFTVREPYGVVAHILPWNAPLSQLARGVAPALASGNTTVIKPSALAPLSTIAFARLASEAGLPDGVANVVLGSGSETGRLLAEHEGVRMISFTGSVEIGSGVLAIAAKRIVPCNLELGGKSAAVVFPDADLERAVAAGVYALSRNAGQSCLALTRFIVHRSVAEEYIEGLRRAIDGMSMGPGIEDPDIGPLISEEQLTKVLELVGAGLDLGATASIGGSRAADGRLAQGAFMQPTVLTRVDRAMPVAQTEIFGPVQCVIEFDTEAEAIELANNSPYGLSAAVFSRDFGTAHRVARRINAGQVQLNAAPIGGIETPFGGYRMSGIGREKGVEAVRHYTQLKTIIGRT